MHLGIAIELVFTCLVGQRFVEENVIDHLREPLAIQQELKLVARGDTRKFRLEIRVRDGRAPIGGEHFFRRQDGSSLRMDHSYVHGSGNQEKQKDWESDDHIGSMKKDRRNRIPPVYSVKPEVLVCLDLQQRTAS